MRFTSVGDANSVSESPQSQLGQRLRQARERRGVSIAQAAADTRILNRYLISLEDGDYDHLPGDVYARGFIRNYAQYLGLPAEELVELYRVEKGSSTGPIRVTQTASMPRIRSCMAPSVVMTFLVVAALAILAYLVANALGLTTKPLTTAPPTPTTVATPNPIPSATINPNGLAETQTVISGGPTNTPGLIATPTAPLSAPLVVVVRIVNGSSWLRVLVDGENKTAQEVKPPGWTETFLAQSKIEIRAGDASKVEIVVNNGPPERLSTTSGQVVTRSITAVPTVTNAKP